MQKVMLLFATLSTFIVYANNESKLPIVYSDRYDMKLFGLEKDQPFDTEKYSKTAKKIKAAFGKDFYEPKGPISDKDLLMVHTQAYLDSLNSSLIVARIAEEYALSYMPNFILQWKLLYPIKLATEGTVKAAELAYANQKWAINLAGGYHHAEPDVGDGFCFFGDVAIAMKKLWEKDPNLRIFYIDCDAHQGNGVEITFKNLLKKGKDSDLIVFDLFGSGDYPTANLTPSESDRKLKEAFKKKGLIDPTEKIWERAKDIQQYIQYSYPLDVSDKTRSVDSNCYMQALDLLIEDLATETEKARKAQKKVFIFYNAGTDPYEFDTVAWLGVTKEKLAERDEKIWQFAKDKHIPLVMTLSGGYADKTKMSAADIIADSIINILTKVWGYTIVEQQPETPKPQSSIWSWLFGWGT